MPEEVTLRLEALKLAFKFSGDMYEDIEEDLFPLANMIFKFLKGETPNE